MVYRKIFRLFAYSVIMILQVFYATAERSIASSEQPYVSIMEDDTLITSGYDYPVYRRIDFGNQIRSFDFGGSELLDILEFHILNDEVTGRRLYENSGDYRNPHNQSDILGNSGGRAYNKDIRTGDYKRDSIGSPGNVISFLGINNSAQYGKTTNYAFYLDTAFINRGSGWIKPQYMLVVDPYMPDECGSCNPETGNIEGANSKYVIGRYLYNTSMYAKVVADSMLIDVNKWGYADKYYDKEKGEGIPVSATETESGYLFKRDNFNKVQPVKIKDVRSSNGEAYVYDGHWERFAFSWAIHKGDSLYVLKGVGLEPVYKGAENDPHQVWLTLTREYGKEGMYVDFSKLISENIIPGSAYKEAYYSSDRRSSYPEMRTYYDFKPAAALSPGKTIGLQAIIALDDNTHKDWVFSFRLIDRLSDDFVIESETTDRNTGMGPMIAQGWGGWIKYQNGVPVISRSDEKDFMLEAAVFNVKKINSSPVNNDNVDEETNVKIVGGTGNVVILNATGKKVVISNAIGNIVANTIISSDNTIITTPPGLIIVAVEGERAAKVVVK